jgi:hypothetical protein
MSIKAIADNIRVKRIVDKSLWSYNSFNGSMRLAWIPTDEKTHIVTYNSKLKEIKKQYFDSINVEMSSLHIKEIEEILFGSKKSPYAIIIYSKNNDWMYPIFRYPRVI